jgi:hypothetical protein
MTSKSFPAHKYLAIYVFLQTFQQVILSFYKISIDINIQRLFFIIIYNLFFIGAIYLYKKKNYSLLFFLSVFSLFELETNVFNYSIGFAANLKLFLYDKLGITFDFGDSAFSFNFLDSGNFIVALNLSMLPVFYFYYKDKKNDTEST